MTPSTKTPEIHRLDPATALAAVRKRSYCTVSTVSSGGHPHAAGVLYQLVDRRLIINTHATSRKARNIATTNRVGVVIPVRRVPVGGPPSAIQFQADARIADADDPAIADLIDRGALGSITGHGELDHPDSCFIMIDLPDRLHTYGLGMSLWQLIRNPLGAAGIADLPPTRFA